MAQEEVVEQPSHPPPDLKRKLADLEPQEEQQEEETAAAEAPTVPGTDPADSETDDVADDDSPEAKRLRLGHDNGEAKSENGFEGSNLGGNVKGDGVISASENEKVKDDAEDDDAQQLPSQSEVVPESKVKEETDGAHNSEKGDTEHDPAPSGEDSRADDGSKEGTEKQAHEHDTPTSEPENTSHKIEVPNDKVGVLIGKGGDTIRYLQFNSGAKIQITKDADADPHSTMRPVEIVGTLSSIDKAEKLIHAVIAEANIGGSPSLVARGLPSGQSASAGDQLEIQVPNDKVGLIIGKGGETIKGLQARTGARIQLIPQHLPEGDGSKGRTVRVTGDRRQIEMAREMIESVMYQNVRPSSHLSGFAQQQSFRPHRPIGPAYWGPRGPHSSQVMPYDYQLRGPYASQNIQHPPPSYGGYPQQMGSRSNFGSGWDQRPPNLQGSMSHGGGYDYYGGRGSHISDHPISGSLSTSNHGHAPGPSPTVSVGPPLPQVNCNYGQPHGPEYGHQAPYSQTVPSQQGYGHGYDEPKYDNHAPAQHPYGHGSSQPVYAQAGNQPGYGAQQPYGMPSQGPPHSFGPPRPSQPVEMPYQAPTQAGQSYSQNVPSQQQYPYASSGHMQQTYPPYATAIAAEGYSQAPPASGPGYSQQSGQPLPAYGQPGGQQAAGFVQGPSGGYGAYPSSQRSYPEQQPPNNAAYSYQGSQDPAYSAGAGSSYNALPSGQQAYAQPTPSQSNYDQSMPQAGSYGSATVNAPVGYGKTVSPQPGYPQYDTSQMYAAPH